MAKLNWGAIGERIYEAGVDRGVFYPSVGPGLAWSGLISVTEAPEGFNQSVVYIDGMRNRNQISLGDFAAVVEAYTYPDDLEEGLFNFCYRTQTSQGYKLHLVYNALAAPTRKHYETINSTPEAVTFNWNISTTPVNIPDARASSHFVIDSSTTHAWTLSMIEDMLYGTEANEPHFPTVDELLEVFESGAIVRITDHGDGTWTASGPDDVIQMIDATSFEINWPSAIYTDYDTYRIMSL